MPMIDDPNGGRSVKEWIGKTPDSVPPATVRARIFLRADGICHISQRPIGAGEKWELEHVKPLALGGDNRESNMRPALVEAHKAKSADENTLREKADRIRAKHLGVYPKSKAPIRSRGFASTRDGAPTKATRREI